MKTWGQMSDEAQNGDHRALGFAIQTALRYRVRGERHWHDGMTETISNASILFRGEKMIEQGAQVELTFSLPVKLPAGAGAKVMCRGVTEISEYASMISVRFTRLRLLRP
jgi:hypothetical protein